MTSCPDFILGNYVLAFFVDVEYGIFLCSISLLNSLTLQIAAVHMWVLLSYLRNLQGCGQVGKMRE